MPCSQDIIAPGQDILAAVSPLGNSGRLFDLYSGTSMSSPHIAGIAALLKDAHPEWSPMMIKSAIMTTAYDILDGPATDPSVMFSAGAGHVKPNAALDPGLVFDSNWNDWLSALCAAGALSSACKTRYYCAASASPATACSRVGDYNAPSIASGALPGTETFVRTVNNVGSATATYIATVSGLAGMTATISPASFTVAKGAKATFSVTITRVDAPLSEYVGGHLTLSDGTHSVRVPIVVRPVALAAPTEVSSAGEDVSYNVVFGYSGPFAASPAGLVPAAVTPDTVSQDPDQIFDGPFDQPGVVAIPVTLPAGTTYARFQLYDSDVAAGSDLDLYVYQGGSLVGSSGGGTAAEQVNFAFNSPTGGDMQYTAYIHGWGVTGTTPFKLHVWAVGTTSVDNMAVSAPGSATLGSSGTVSLSFSGLAAATRYLGYVAYSGLSGLPRTLVSVETP